MEVHKRAYVTVSLSPPCLFSLIQLSSAINAAIIQRGGWVRKGRPLEPINSHSAAEGFPEVGPSGDPRSVDSHPSGLYPGADGATLIGRNMYKLTQDGSLRLLCEHSQLHHTIHPSYFAASATAHSPFDKPAIDIQQACLQFNPLYFMVLVCCHLTSIAQNPLYNLYVRYLTVRWLLPTALGPNPWKIVMLFEELGLPYEHVSSLHVAKRFYKLAMDKLTIVSP